MDITVGLLTAGVPVMEKMGAHTLLHNLLIGDKFHWERPVEALLPGDVWYDAGSGSLLNRLPVETYLKCVVGSEMNPNAPLEFLKAHAIVSRSWAVGKVLRTHKCADNGRCDTPEMLVDWMDTADHSRFDVCSDDHCQRYQGLQPVSAKAAEAIDSTAGIVLTTPHGEIVDARFSKCCGGHTESFSTCWQDEERECLESFADPWCDYSSLSEKEQEELLDTVLKDYDRTTGTGYCWHMEITKQSVTDKLRQRLGRDVGMVTSLQPCQRSEGGRIRLLRVVGDAGEVVIGKELVIRRLLSDTHLFSSNFEVVDAGDRFLLDGRGWGHGVGMCQVGAARMAHAGHTAKDILAFYYPGARFDTLKYES